MPSPVDELEAFRVEYQVNNKGALCVMLVITRHAKLRGLPLNAENLITEEKGQVVGLGKGAVQAILEEHGIQRVLAEEGGRTSRGSIGHMRRYVELLNHLSGNNGLDLDQVEAWWIERVREYFASKGFTLHYDPSKSLHAIVQDVLQQAFKRQSQEKGTKYAGTVLQHMVGAKLALSLPPGSVEHHGSSVADQSSHRGGDFSIDDVVIHVTTAPSEALLRKCKQNLESGLKPIIVTTSEGLPGAQSLAVVQGIADRVDMLEAAQFIAANLHEKSLFKSSQRKPTVEAFVAKYNQIVRDCETDPGLQIVLGS